MIRDETAVTDASAPAPGTPPVADLVHVWLVPTDQPPSVLARLAALLDDEERRRAATHRSAVQRARFVAAHGAARRIVAAHLGLEPGGFAWRRGEHGKPEPDVGTADAVGDGTALGTRISISACAEVALVAVAQPGSPEPGAAPTPREVWIDVERLIADQDAIRLSARFFPPDQAEYVASAPEHGGPAERFATLWCRKEACVKALGGRLVQGLGLAVCGGSPLVTRFPDSQPAEMHDEYRLCDVPAPTRFRAAVALKGAAPYRLRCHVWSDSRGPHGLPD
jgi:4'-phosphopantetheinyl transferase